MWTRAARVCACVCVFVHVCGGGQGSGWASHQVGLTPPPALCPAAVTAHLASQGPWGGDLSRGTQRQAQPGNRVVTSLSLTEEVEREDLEKTET